MRFTIFRSQSKKEVSKAKEETSKHQADSSAGSTWEDIKGAAGSAKDQAANKIDKNTSEFKAKVIKIGKIPNLQVSSRQGSQFQTHLCPGYI